MNEETGPARVLRRWLLAILTLGIAGTLAELILLGHFEDRPQWVPLWLLTLGVAAIGACLLAPGARTILLLRLLMAGFVAAGLAGVALHYRGNVEFELEMYPDRHGLELVREALAGATPALAPGTMIVLGLIGLAYTTGHPLLSVRRRRDD